MSYRSILTYVDASSSSKSGLESAIGITRQFDAHLTVMAMGYNPNVPVYAYGEVATSVVADFFERASKDSSDNLATAEAAIKAAGILGDAVPKVCLHGTLAREIGEHAQFADLIVMSPPYEKDAPRTAGDAFEGALLDGNAAVLVCPPGATEIATDNILIAWNGTREALRAIRRALPFLKQANAVEILMIRSVKSESDPGERLAVMLSRHGVSAEIQIQPPASDSISAILQRRAEEMGAGLLVMGGYGHSRFREYFIGGVTRDVLSETRTPVLLAH